MSAVGPPLHVNAVEATFGDATGVAWQGLADASGVPTQARISVTFDRYLEPATAARRQSICLSTALDDSIKKLTDCTSPALQLVSPSYDPVERRVTFDVGELAANTRYQLSLFSAADGGFGFVAFDGAPLELRPQDLARFAGSSGDSQVLRLQFTTADATVALGPLPDEDPTGLYCGALDTLKDRCTACHGAGGTMGMSLTRGGILSSALGIVAHETELGGHAAVASEAPARFGVRMARLFEGDPGNSYVLYKILASADGTWNQEGMAAGEADRLRLSVVTGMPMSPDGAMSRDDALRISRWIGAGAHVRDCIGK